MYILAFVIWLIASSAGAALIETPVSSLPTGAAEGTTRIVIDGQNETDCSGGGGVYSVLCTSDGADEWRPGGGGIGTPPATPAGLGPNFAISGGNIIPDSSESKPFEIRGQGAQATRYIRIYVSSSGEFVITCVDGGVEGACKKVTRLNAGFDWEVQDSTSTTRLGLNEATGRIKAINVNGEDAGVTITLLRKLCGGNMAAVDPATGTASHLFDKDPTSSVPTATAFAGANQGYGFVRFPDSDGTYGVSLSCPLMAGWVGQVDILVWAKTSGAGNFVLQNASKCYASDEVNDAAYPAATAFTFAAGTSNRLNRYVGSNIAMAGCAGTELAFYQFLRSRQHASDTLNAALDIKEWEIWGRNDY